MTTKRTKSVHKRNRTTIKKKPCCMATVHGLHKWFAHSFEHLGWMVLAKAHGHNDKVEVYKRSLDHLKKAIEERIENLKDYDKKQDLYILHKNVLILIEHANKDF